MYKKILIVSTLLAGMTSSIALAQNGQSLINKCDNKKDPIIYTEFECPEGYTIVTEGWLSETNMTAAGEFADDDQIQRSTRKNNEGREPDQDNYHR